MDPKTFWRASPQTPIKIPSWIIIIYENKSYVKKNHVFKKSYWSRLANFDVFYFIIYLFFFKLIFYQFIYLFIYLCILFIHMFMCMYLSMYVNEEERRGCVYVCVNHITYWFDIPSYKYYFIHRSVLTSM